MGEMALRWEEGRISRAISVLVVMVVAVVVAVLTLHAQPVGAVLGLQVGALAVSPAVLGRRRAALPPPPVGALHPTGRPLTPLCPQAVHWSPGSSEAGRVGRGKKGWGGCRRRV